MASETQYSCPHKRAAEEVAKGQWVMTQLQCLMLLEDGPELAELLLQQALFFTREALGMLAPCDCDRFPLTVERRSDRGKSKAAKFSGRKKTQHSSLVHASSADVEGRSQHLLPSQIL
ncbi:hypothetical protein KSP40_PGU017047 [Platanthera guangdongensis]|uniref:Uncharacterized protein n=1 Tax=Platanthera guangdongensis TaxID=2320717 RepID=A0ABR2LZW0_9ASPA